MGEIDSYEYWMDQLASRSQSTREVYKTYFDQFLEYANATPNELVEMQREALEGGGDPRENHVVESKVRAWLAETKESKSVATRRMMLSATKSFFALNLHPLRLNRLDRPQGESVGSRIPEREEVVCIADAGKWKYRTAVMFLKDSGLRISDVVMVKWEDKVDMGDGFWNFNLLTKKKQVQACAFVGPDTTRLLIQFTNKTGRIFRTGARNMVRQVNKLIRMAEIEGLTAHGLRKFFVTSMQQARVQEQYYLHMMGKKSSVYSEKWRSTLFESYKKAYSELSVYTQKQRDVEVLRDIEELKKENEALRRDYATLSQKYDLFRKEKEKRDRLMSEVEELSRLPGGRKFFESIVNDAKTKLREFVKAAVESEN